MSHPTTLQEALEYVFVDGVDKYHAELNKLPDHMIGWYYVATGDLSVIAYFAFESDAYRFKMNYVNTLLNPIEE